MCLYNNVRRILFSPKTQKVAFLTRKCELVLSDSVHINEGVIVPNFKSSYLLEFSSDGKKIAGLDNKRTLWIYDIENETLTQYSTQGIREVNSIQFSRSGNYIFLVSSQVFIRKNELTKVLVIDLINNKYQIESFYRAYNMGIKDGFKDTILICKKRIKSMDKFYQPEYFALYDWKEDLGKFDLRYEIAPSNNYVEDFDLILDSKNNQHISMVKQSLIIHSIDSLFKYESILDVKILLKSTERVTTVVLVDQVKGCLICCVEDIESLDFYVMIIDYYNKFIISKKILEGMPEFISLERSGRYMSYGVWKDPCHFSTHVLSLL